MTVSGAANRRRGHDAERAVVRYLRDQGFVDACTTRNTGGAGGRQVGDVSFIPGVTLEVKDVAVPAWPAWLRQAAGEAAGFRVPVVTQRLRGTPDVSQWPTVLPGWAWSTMEPDDAPNVMMVDKVVGDLGALLGNLRVTSEVVRYCPGPFPWAVMRFATLVDAVRLDR